MKLRVLLLALWAWCCSCSLEGAVHISEEFEVTAYVDTNVDQVTIQMSFTAGVWFSAGFGSAMHNSTYAIVIDGTGQVSERKLGPADEGVLLTFSMEELANEQVSDMRRVILRRQIEGLTNDHYTFPTIEGSIDMIWAFGTTSDVQDHGTLNRGITLMQFWELETSQPTIVPDEKCSAIRAFVRVTDPPALQETLLSAQALFEPFVYRVDATPVSVLYPINDDICDPGTGINTDISGTVVLIERGGDCSEHYKVYVAEQAGAVGVLIYDNEDINYVEEIEDDPDVDETEIPARMITQEDGWTISNYVENDEPVIVEFGCFDNDYPSQVCVEDVDGTWWWVDGEYQQQYNETYNDHPVFKKEGYVGVVYDLFLFLDHEDGGNKWRWTISEYYLDPWWAVAYCTETVEHPADCPKWKEYIWWWGNYSYAANFTVTEEICAVPEDHLCVGSENSFLSGIDGTYHQTSKKVGIWIRSITKADSAPAYLVWTYWWGDSPIDWDFDEEEVYGFVLADSLDHDPIAYCEVGHEDDIDDIMYAEFNPQDCEEWWVLKDFSTRPEYLLDETFFIDTAQCPDETTRTPSEVSEYMCLSGHSLNHIFLEGGWEMMEDVTTSSGRHVWYNPRLDGTSYEAYMWFYGDYNDNYMWWVIADEPPDEPYPAIYAYCPSDVDSPTDCASCWYFYYYDAFDADCSVDLDPGTCTTTEAPDEDVYPDQLCVDVLNKKEGSSRWDSMTGTYAIADDEVNGRAYWHHEEDNDDWYVFYDDVLRYWFISETLSTSQSLLMCQQYENFDPADCTRWEFWSDNAVNVTMTHLDCVGLDSSEDSKKSSSSGNHAGVAVGVTFAILAVVLIVVGFIYYRTRKQQGKPSIDMALANADANQTATDARGGAKQTHRRLESQSLELGNVDFQTITTPADNGEDPRLDAVPEKEVVQPEEDAAAVDEEDEPPVELAGDGVLPDTTTGGEDQADGAPSTENNNWTKF